MSETLSELSLNDLERQFDEPANRRSLQRDNIPYLRVIKFIVLLGVLALGMYVHWKGIQSNPGPVNDDEGTYVAQAWAVVTGLGPHHGPAQYTYWYDHPPVSWLQIAFFAWVTGLDHSGQFLSVLVAREYMLIYFFVDMLCVFYILRQLKAGFLLSIGGVLLLAVSPLSVFYLRQVFLDTIGSTWLLLSIALLLSKRSWLARAVLSGTTLGIAALSKETIALFLPAFLVYLWLNTKPPIRKFTITAFLAASGTVVAFYLLFAILRGELFPGPHHTSLIGGVEWQLFQRGGGGSIFTKGSANNGVTLVWWGLDPALLVGTLVFSIVCLFRRSTIIFGLGNLIGAIMMLRSSGYLPAMFVVAYIATGIIAIAMGTRILLDSLASFGGMVASRLRLRGVRSSHVVDITANDPSKLVLEDKYGRRRLVDDSRVPALLRRRYVLTGVTTMVLLTSGIGLYPSYHAADTQLMSSKADAWVAVGNAERWVVNHVPKNKAILTDDYVWTDFVINGFPPDKVVWVWKNGPDPQVNHRYPHQLREFDYIISTENLRSAMRLTSAHYDSQDANQIRTSALHRDYILLEHSRVIKRFGTGFFRVSIRKITPGTVECPGQCLAYALQ